jgi:phage shock protein C
MFCTQCGVELEPQDRYCCQCGKGTGGGSPWPARVSQRRLTLDSRNKKIAGVCAGFARYLDLDVTLVRIVWMILVLVPPGLGLICYVLAWLIMPAEEDVAAVTEPSAVPR